MAMDRRDIIVELRKELFELERENTELRSKIPARTMKNEAEALIFEVKQLRTQVARCHNLMREYQAQIRRLTEDFFKRHPPRVP